MSIGNLKDEGNKGNNFPFQLKVLQGLQAVIDNNCCDSIISLLSEINTKLRADSRTPGLLSVTGSGATPANVYSISIANVGAAAGVIDGVSIPAGTVLNFDGGVLNNTVTPMSYNATGTTFLITYLA